MKCHLCEQGFFCQVMNEKQFEDRGEIIEKQYFLSEGLTLKKKNSQLMKKIYCLDLGPAPTC